MQNVLMQIGLKAIATSGQYVSALRRYTQFCHACRTLCPSLDRQFCPACGNHSLVRAVVHINRDGIPRYGFSLRHIYNYRGTKYAVPMPKGGRNNQDLVLSEDSMRGPRGSIQPPPSSSSSNRRRNNNKGKGRGAKGDMFLDTVEFGVDRNGAAGGYRPPPVGYGRLNPNENRRRRK